MLVEIRFGLKKLFYHCFEKLAQTSITLGMDIIEAYQSRDALIQENELAVSLPEVLKVRDSGIVYYTKEIGKLR